MSAMLNPRHIEAFVAIARTGSTIGAAEALNTSQPSVSRMLRALENQLGFPLFERDSGRLRICREGQMFYNEVARFYEGLSQLDARVTEIRNLRDSEFRLATIAATSTFVVPSVLSEVREVYPQLRTNVMSRSHSRVLDLVATGRADIGITNHSTLPESVRLHCQWDFACVCAIPSSHPLAERATIRLDDFGEHTFISLGEHFNSTYASDPDVAERLNSAADHWSNLSMPALFQVAANLGIAIIDPFSARLADRLGLRVKPLEFVVQYPVSLVKTLAVPTSHITDFFLRQLVEAIELEGGKAAAW